MPSFLLSKLSFDLSKLSGNHIMTSIPFYINQTLIDFLHEALKDVPVYRKIVDDKWEKTNELLLESLGGMAAGQPLLDLGLTNQYIIAYLIPIYIDQDPAASMAALIKKAGFNPDSFARNHLTAFCNQYRVARDSLDANKIAMLEKVDDQDLLDGSEQLMTEQVEAHRWMRMQAKGEE